MLDFNRYPCVLQEKNLTNPYDYYTYETLYEIFYEYLSSTIEILRPCKMKSYEVKLLFYENEFLHPIAGFLYLYFFLKIFILVEWKTSIGKKGKQYKTKLIYETH